jgi:hypothetical protein
MGVDLTYPAAGWVGDQKAAVRQRGQVGNPHPRLGGWSAVPAEPGHPIGVAASLSCDKRDSPPAIYVQHADLIDRDEQAAVVRGLELAHARQGVAERLHRDNAEGPSLVSRGRSRDQETGNEHDRNDHEA